MPGSLWQLARASSFVCLAGSLAIDADVGAETLVSAGSGVWRSASTGTVAWSGGTASADDDFRIEAGTSWRSWAMSRSPPARSRSRPAAGSWSARLALGAQLVVRSGGTYEQTGAVVASCRIAREPDWSGADPQVRLPCATLASTGDSLVLLDEDPPDGLWTGHTALIGPGLAPNALRAALGRYAWYDIISLEGTRVGFDLDAGTYATTPGAPYQGTRGNPTRAPIGASQLRFVAQPGRRATRVEIAASYGSVVAMPADLGSYYLYFTEDALQAADPTRCSRSRGQDPAQ